MGNLVNVHRKVAAYFFKKQIKTKQNDTKEKAKQFLFFGNTSKFKLRKGIEK